MTWYSSHRPPRMNSPRGWNWPRPLGLCQRANFLLQEVGIFVRALHSLAQAVLTKDFRPTPKMPEPGLLVVGRALAEGVGFEPTVPCGTLVFKTSAFDHSATPP
jgi:hypothetical protein